VIRGVALTAALAVAALIGVLAAEASGPQALAGTVVERSFHSSAGTLSFDVYLPPGYSTSGLRYPVVYYLHGLPASATAYRTFEWVPRALEAAGKRSIVVAPEGARTGESDPEYLDTGAGHDWETAIAVQLPRLIDAGYRTIPERRGRAIVGVSAGGYGAMLLGLHHLGRFGAIESWSGYFHPTDPTGTHSISSNPWLSAHALIGTLKRADAKAPTFVGFYVGASDLRFRQENDQLAAELRAADVPFTFRTYPGGHSQALWTAQAPAWLALALGSLLAPG
jgi:S-formylglutathione hydrolase FrmB